MAKKKHYKKMNKKLLKRKVARTNKKLLTIVVVITGAIIFGLGGLWYFVEYRGAERNMTSGDSYFAEGAYKNARKQYGRAVTKDPANPQYINKLQEAILKVVPVTPAEARAAYDEYIRILVHKSRYNPLDIQSHLNVAEEMYTYAFMTGLDNNWGKLRSLAQNGLDQIALDNPRRHELLLYRGLATLRIEDASMTETYDDIGNVRFPGESDFEAVLERDPGNAMAWAALAHGRMAVYYRLNDEGQTSQAARNIVFANETMAQAQEVAGDTFEVAAVVLREMLLRRTALLQQRVAKPASVSQERLDEANANIVDARTTLVAGYNPAIHYARAGEMATLVSSTDKEGLESAVEILIATVEEHPNDFGRKFMLSGILVSIEREDEVIEIANAVLDSENQPVGIHAVELFAIRPLFAQLLVQLYLDKAQGIEDEQSRALNIDVAKKYREVLHELVSGKEENQMLLYSDGLIALSEEKYSLAATKLEEAITRNPDLNPRVYRQVAFALSKTNAKGLAIEFLQVAIGRQPSNLANYLAKAQLEIQLSKPQDAAFTLSVLPEVTRARDDVQELINLIAMQREDADSTAFSDVTMRVISQSEQLSKMKKYDDAHQLLDDAMNQMSDPDWRLFVAKSNIYQKMDEKDSAIDWLNKAIDLIPDPSRLMPQLHVLQTVNRVDALVSLIESQEGTEAEKAEELAVSLYDLSINYRGEASRWLQLGNREEADKAKEVADYALEESNKYQAIATSLDADLSRIISLQFNKAITSDNFDEAERTIESLVEHEAPQLDISASRISLHLAKAVQAKKRGQLDVYNTHTLKALTIAEQMIKDYSISDFAWRAYGRVLFEMKEIEEATKAYAEAHRISPKDKENIRSYVAVLAQQQGLSQRLLRVLRTAKDQYPTDRQIRMGWLEAERLFGEPWKVLVYRMNQIIMAPGDRVNGLELAYLLSNTQPTRDLIRDINGKEIYSARMWEQMPPRTQEASLEDARKEWNKTIAQILESASESVDPNIRIAALHAATHRNLGQLERSSEIWDRFITSLEGTDEYTTAVIAAAEFLNQSSRPVQASQLLEKARDAQSELYEIDAVLGSLYYSVGRNKEAAEMLRLPVQATKNTMLHSRLIEALALSGQFIEAEQSLEEYTTTNSAFAKAMLRALISRVRSEQLLAQGDIVAGTAALDIYRNALRDAITADSRSQVPYIRLCQSLLNEYRLTQEKALLEEALQVADEATGAGNLSEQFSVVRANVLQANGQLNRSIDQLSRYLSENPKSSLVRQRLIEAYLDSDNVDRALTAAKAGVALDSSDASWHQRLGDLHLRANDDVGQGVKAYLLAIQKKPNVRLLLKIDEVTRTEQQLPNQELIAMATGPLAKLHPIASAIEAKALKNLGRNRDALLAMQRSWIIFQQAIDKGWIPPQSMGNWFLDLKEFFKDDPAAGETFVRELAGSELSQYQLAGLAGYYNAFGNEYAEHSINIIKGALELTKEDQDARLQLLMMLGGFQVGAKQFKESEVTFRALAEESDSPLVQNNLAYVIGVYQNRPDEGLIIAKKAAIAAPREPSVVDTVATMYHRLGEYEQSAKALDFLLQIDPKNSRAMAKLSLLYSDNLGEPERGLVFAERGRSQNPRSPQVLDAIGWSYYRMGNLERAEETVRRSIRQGDTMEAYLHLAQIVTENQEFTEALGHLRMAEELAEDAFSMNRINALKDDIHKKKNESK
jgi:tetratricopeptide (TPR) repeat protein